MQTFTSNFYEVFRTMQGVVGLNMQQWESWMVPFWSWVFVFHEFITPIQWFLQSLFTFVFVFFCFFQRQIELSFLFFELAIGQNVHLVRKSGLVHQKYIMSPSVGWIVILKRWLSPDQLWYAFEVSSGGKAVCRSVWYAVFWCWGRGVFYVFSCQWTKAYNSPLHAPPPQGCVTVAHIYPFQLYVCLCSCSEVVQISTRARFCTSQ